ncbi:hypothetical protein H6P81_005932 [Aristolochia fimbriata]|uniref:Transcriptional regulator SLK2 n=1 Tax=Aristolochia fimbriata TaxID=158543 RepID=A0AAV7EWC2_ARIFI|nr:hypothetical protein H6P81_005932 [Aristolochia fimbriata]
MVPPTLSLCAQVDRLFHLLHSFSRQEQLQLLPASESPPTENNEEVIFIKTDVDEAHDKSFVSPEDDEEIIDNTSDKKNKIRVKERRLSFTDSLIRIPARHKKASPRPLWRFRVPTGGQAGVFYSQLGFLPLELALERYLDPSHQSAVPAVAPSRVAGGPAQSSSTSGIFFQGDGSQAPVNSQLNSSFVNSSGSISAAGRSTAGPASGGDMNRVLNSTANSGPSVGASSLVTDANSALSGGSHLQRSASINAESYMRLPASPMSFSSNNISISGSSVLDGSSIVQQSPHQDHTSQQIGQRQQHQAASSATSQPTGLPGQISSAGAHVPSSFNQDTNSLLPVQKKPRLDIRQEDVLQQQVIQQLLQRQDSVQGHNPHLQALLQQQKIMQQRQHLLQSMPQIQRAHIQQQQQQQMRHHLQQGVHPSTAIRRPYDSGICARRLMQYIYHQRHRPADNSILYWRKFVAEYFAPRAKKRWCLSLYDSVGHHALGAFPQASMDAWHCDICGSKSGRGFETTYEVLPRLSKIKFDSGVIDELLFLDMPHEYRFPSGLMMLEYGKAIQESVYEQLRVIREGQLRIIFTPDLKILSWEFCARRHEELLPRRLVAPQVNQLVQVAQKYQSAVNEGGSAGISSQDLQTNCNMFVTAGRQLARNLDLQSLNDLGFSKRYVRCLQISEVVSSMKDLIDFSRDNSMGPIESLKNYPRLAAQAKIQIQKMQEMEQLANVRGLPADQNNLTKIMAVHPGLSTHLNNSQMSGGNPNSSAVQSAVALSNYQNLLRQNSMNSSSNNNVHVEASTSFSNPQQAQSLPFQSTVSSVPGSTLQNSASSQPCAHSPQNLIKPGQPSSPANQHLQQHMIQQLLQEMMNNNNGSVQQQSIGGQNTTTNSADDVFAGAGGTGSLLGRVGPSMVGFGNNSVVNNTVGLVPSRNNSFKTVSSSSPTVSGSSFIARQDATQNLHLPELVNDIPREFSDSGLFSDEGFGWKS